MSSVKMKAKSVEEAVEMALQVLGRSREDVDVRVIQEGEAGMLGVFGGKEAEVEVSPKMPLGEHAKTILQEIFDKMSFLTLVTVGQEDGDNIYLDIKGEDMGRIIGKGGATLDSLQYLVSTIVSRKFQKRVRILLDAEGYREKRKQKMNEEAQVIAKEVESSGKEKSMPPMTAAERRLVHLFIQENFPELTSFSRGEGIGRQIVIAPKQA